MSTCKTRARSPEEIRERNRLQIEDCQQYYNFACLVEGRDLTQTELVLWYVRMGFAKMFEVEWHEGQNPETMSGTLENGSSIPQPP
jgi:hypothetical protein